MVAKETVVRELQRSVFVVARELIRNADGILKASFCVPSSEQFQKREAIREKKMADLGYTKYELRLPSVLCGLLEASSEQFGEVAILLKMNLGRSEYIVAKELDRKSVV